LETRSTRGKKMNTKKQRLSEGREGARILGRAANRSRSEETLQFRGEGAHASFFNEGVGKKNALIGLLNLVGW